MNIILSGNATRSDIALTLGPGPPGKPGGPAAPRGPWVEEQHEIRIHPM